MPTKLRYAKLTPEQKHKVRQAALERHYRNREKSLQRLAEYRKSHEVQRREYREQWRAKNLVKIKRYSKDYYWQNRDCVLAKNTAWGKAHRELKTAHENHRRARKLNATVADPVLIQNWERSWKQKTRVTCYWCKGKFKPKKCHSDHVIPLSKGGEHSLRNLAISCAKCNVTKNAKSLEEWNLRLTQQFLL